MSYYMRILIYAMKYCTVSFYNNHQYNILITILTKIKMGKNRFDGHVDSNRDRQS